MADPYMDEGQRRRMNGEQNFGTPQPGNAAMDPYAPDEQGIGNGEGGYNPKARQLFYGGYAGGAQDDVNRARDLASSTAGRSAYGTNLGGFNQSRDYTMGSLAGLDAAARGTAPSRAEIAGNAAMDRSLANEVAAAGSVRGGPANQASAYRRAATQAAGQRQQMTQGIAAERAGEMATARGQLMQGALGSQSQDLGAANLQQQAELEQRRLNQQGSQFYEQQGSHVRDAELAAAMQRQQMADQRGQASRNQTMQDENNMWGKFKDTVGMAAGAASGATGAAGKLLTGSDPNMKMTMPWGSLSSLAIGAQGPDQAPGGVDLGGGGSITGAMVNKASTGLAGNTGGIPGMVGGGGITGGAVDLGPNGMGSDMRMKTFDSDMRMKNVGYTESDPRAKVPARLGASDASADREVENRRRKGGYAELDMTPISEGAQRESDFDTALRGSGEGAMPYAQPPKTDPNADANAQWQASFGDASADAAKHDNAAEMARTRANFGQAPGEQPADGGGGITGALGSLFSGIGGGASGRFSSDPRTKDSAGKVPALQNAARSLEPEVYSYKDEYLPPEQKRGEVNVGPMANKMAKDPVAGTAIVKDPKTEMLAIDIPKYTKVLGAVAAGNQKQDDVQEQKLNAIMGSLASLAQDVPDADSAKRRRGKSDSVRSIA